MTPEAESTPTEDPNLAAWVEHVRADIDRLAQGNGVTRPVEAGDFSYGVYRFTGQVVATLDVESTYERKPCHELESGAVRYDSPASGEYGATETCLNSLADEGLRQRAWQVLASHPLEGFGLHGQNLSLDFVSRLVAYEVCQQCGGRREFVCMACQGRGEITCHRCQGTGSCLCEVCGGHGQRLEYGFHNGSRHADERHVKCWNCNGGRKPCGECGRRGLLQCGGCGGRGSIVCAGCDGCGQITHLWTITPVVRTIFETEDHAHGAWIDPWMEDLGGLATAGLGEYGEVRSLGAWPVGNGQSRVCHYALDLPLIVAGMNVEGQAVHAGIYPQNGSYRVLSHYLELPLQKGFASLRLAATEGSVNARVHLQNAARYRALNTAVYGVAQTKTPAEVVATLREEYPSGLSPTAMETAVEHAAAGLNRLQTPWAGVLVLGLLLSAGVLADYFATIRPQLIEDGILSVRPDGRWLSLSRWPDGMTLLIVILLLPVLLRRIVDWRDARSLEPLFGRAMAKEVRSRTKKDWVWQLVIGLVGAVAFFWLIPRR